MTVGEKKERRRERTVGEIIWSGAGGRLERKDGWKRKDGPRSEPQSKESRLEEYTKIPMGSDAGL